MSLHLALGDAVCAVLQVAWKDRLVARMVERLRRDE